MPAAEGFFVCVFFEIEPRVSAGRVGAFREFFSGSLVGRQGSCAQAMEKLAGARIASRSFGAAGLRKGDRFLLPQASGTGHLRCVRDGARET